MSNQTNHVISQSKRTPWGQVFLLVGAGIAGVILYSPLERCLIMSKIMIMSKRIRILDKGVGFLK